MIVIERIQIRHHKHCIEDRQASLSPGKVGTLKPAPVEEHTECEQAKANVTADPSKIQNPETQAVVLLRQGVLDQIIQSEVGRSTLTVVSIWNSLEKR